MDKTYIVLIAFACLLINCKGYTLNELEDNAGWDDDDLDERQLIDELDARELLQDELEHREMLARIVNAQHMKRDNTMQAALALAQSCASCCNDDTTCQNECLNALGSCNSSSQNGARSLDIDLRGIEKRAGWWKRNKGKIISVAKFILSLF